MKDNNYLILEKILFSKQPKTTFFNQYKNMDFKNYLDSLLPEVNACIYQEQKSVWHLYNVLEHTLIALKKANELTKNFTYYERQIVLFSVFFHDLGKPYCLVKKKNSQGEIYYGFPSHNLKSVEIFNRVKDSLYLTNSQISIIENLILNHDTFNDEERQIDQNLYNEKYNQIKGKIEDNLIDFYLKSLVIVAKSDNFAQNRIKAKPTLKKVLAFEKLLNK